MLWLIQTYRIFTLNISLISPSWWVHWCDIKCRTLAVPSKNGNKRFKTTSYLTQFFLQIHDMKVMLAGSCSPLNISFEYFLEQGIDMRDVYIPIMFMAMCRFFYESQDLEKAKQEIQGFMQDAQSNEFNNRIREAKGREPLPARFLFTLHIRRK